MLTNKWSTAEDIAMQMVSVQAERARIENGWPHILRSAIWPGLDRVIVVIATEGQTPCSVSMDVATAKQFVVNVNNCIEKIEKGEHNL